MAQLSSSKARAVALAMTAATAMTFSSQLNAQQMAANGAQRPAVTLQDCSALSVLADRTACELVVRTNMNIVATQQSEVRTQQANDESHCAGELKSLRTNDPSVVERGRAILGNTPASFYGLCKLLAQLRNG